MPRKLLTEKHHKKVSIEAILRGDCKECAILRDFMKWPKVTGSSEPYVSFKPTDLFYWLLANNRDLVKEFRGQNHNKYGKLAIKRSYLKLRVNQLVDLGLMQITGKVKSEKNPLLTTTYRFTDEAKLFGLLLSFQESSGTREAESLKALIAGMEQYFGKGNGYMSAFAGKVIREWLRDSKTPKENKIELVAYFLSEKYSIDRFLEFLEVMPGAGDILIRVVNGLPADQKKYVLLEIKSRLESEVGLRSGREWEQARFENLHDFSKVILEATCLSCHAIYPYSIDILKIFDQRYMSRIDRDFHLPKKARADCIKCGAKDMLKLFPAWHSYWNRAVANFYVES